MLPKMKTCDHHSSFSLEALNLLDCDERCRHFLAARAPKLKWALMTLERLSDECKTMTDRNDVDFDISRLRPFLKNLSTNLQLEIDCLSLPTKAKYAFFRKGLVTILQDSTFQDYVSFLKCQLAKCTSVEEIEIWLRKFVKVCQNIPRSLHICSKNVQQYKFMAELLDFCYNVDIQDSQLVISLVRITVDWYIIDSTDTRHVRQPFYKEGFLRYILQHSINLRFDLISYCSKHPRTLWEYSRNFSVLNAAAFGNVERTLILLQHGVEIFTAKDIEKSGHGFPKLSQVIPAKHLLILQMMCSMRCANLFILSVSQSANMGLCSVTQDQKTCFELLWRAIPDPYVKFKEIAASVFEEHHFLVHHSVMNSIRYENNRKYLCLYEICFKDMATGPKEPRTLKHLSRCTIRKSMKQAWKLPSGLSLLRLPKILHDYLNLEYD
ncbi:uncharacterized protein LOC118191255 [Stegodyphus dumicola]|uniref:uncharacterized protein LOC118191255 n=1 Tax=Stegodyphus dumicola TaxID=202533 RepID=UPI0015A9AD48|nr:uncharacterized protein LOC118191255 [Stegodyphus dumicola]